MMMSEKLTLIGGVEVNYVMTHHPIPSYFIEIRLRNGPTNIATIYITKEDCFKLHEFALKAYDGVIYASNL